jgi:hypothetical protein
MAESLALAASSTMSSYQTLTHVPTMMQEKENQFAEECARRDRLESERNDRNNFLFSQLFSVISVQMP